MIPACLLHINSAVERKMRMAAAQKLPKPSPGRVVVMSKGKPKPADKRPRTVKVAAAKKASRKTKARAPG